METEDRLTALELRAKGLNTRMNKVWDWISTHDERMAKADSLIELAKAKVEDARTWWHNQPIEPKPREPLKDGVPCEQMRVECDGSVTTSIVSELEAGLKKMDDGKWWHDTDKPCTYILLPMAKYEEYMDEFPVRGFDKNKQLCAVPFHDIPVFGLPIDRIIFGTE